MALILLVLGAAVVCFYLVVFLHFVRDEKAPPGKFGYPTESDQAMENGAKSASE
jgi:hypothetical protein